MGEGEVGLELLQRVCVAWTLTSSPWPGRGDPLGAQDSDEHRELTRVGPKDCHCRPSAPKAWELPQRHAKARFTDPSDIDGSSRERRNRAGANSESVLWRTVIERRAFSAKHTLLRCPKVLYQFHRRQRKIALTGGLSPCEAARDFICEQQPNQTAKA